VGDPYQRLKDLRATEERQAEEGREDGEGNEETGEEVGWNSPDIGGAARLFAGR